MPTYRASKQKFGAIIVVDKWICLIVKKWHFEKKIMKNFVPIFVNLNLLLLLAHQCNSQPQQIGDGGGITNATTTTTNGGQLQIKVGLLFVNGTQRLRSLFGFGQSAPAISLALRRANQEHLVDSLNFTFSWLNCDCFQPWGIGYANKLLLEQNVDVIIGPPCVSTALVAGYDASFYNIPMFLWGATVASDLADDTLYPTVVNTNVNSKMLSMAIRALLANYNWSEVAFVYSPDNERMVCQYFQADFETLVNSDPNLTIVFKRKMDSSPESMRSALIAIANRARIVVGCFDTVADRRQFLLAITDMGLDSKNAEFVFILCALRGLGMLQPGSTAAGGGNQTDKYIPMWLQQDGLGTADRNNDGLMATRRVIVVDLENQSFSEMEEFNRNMIAEFGKYPFNCAGQCMGGPTEQIPANLARTLYDSTYAYFLALNKTMAKYGSTVSVDMLRNGTLLVSMIKSTTFRGQTGTVVTDAYGNRQPTFFATMLDGTDTPRAFINITIVQTRPTNATDASNNDDQSATSTTAFTTLFTPMYNSKAEVWVNYGGNQPLTTPRCGYTGKECPQDMGLYIYLGSGLILLLIAATGAAFGIAIRAKLVERDRLTRECLIPFADLRNLKELRSMEELNSEASKSMRSMHSSGSGATKLTLGSNNKKLETDSYAHFVHNREIVFGAKYMVKVRIDSQELLGQLRKLRLIDHDNLNKFVGICTDAPILYAIWKHCQRGSLKDLIAKEQYVGDVFVMVSLMRDLTSGLAALQQSFVGAHGSLSSENCLINDRWQVKISDFGLNMIRESQPMPRAKLLWTAPELLRQNNRSGTTEGDVYSFAIICVELINRETVWNGTEREEDIDEIIYRLKRTNIAIPHRPQIRQSEAIRDHQSLIHLVRDCWAENPSERPKIERVRTILRQLNRESASQNLMDYVFAMLEQYANSLEQEVEERTKELVEEKRKSDILLCRMLPKEVAEKLKLGESVEPESFQMATVLFSDVVSFTTLASKCTPLQVVNLLNDLYTTFDNIIDTYDAYKVETIGDGYLVCSGIPKRNGDLHAREIAELAFAFLRAVANFRIDHLHAERVNLRIGFHTGPAVAGVVGLTMPRYCLFGDTVNTASRMESNGKAAQIHISNTSNHYLTKVIGGYVTEPRGEVIIKGKGVMETFWLLGHSADGADIPPMYRAFVDTS